MHAQLDRTAELEMTTYSPRVLKRQEPQQLVQAHLGLVRKIAWHVHAKVSSAVEIEDLIQIGMVALLEAARTFVDRGQAAFSTYATMRIRGAMIDQLRRQATMVRSGLQRRRQIADARTTLGQILGRKPDDGEVAAHLGMSLEAFRAAEEASRGIRYESIDEVYSDHSIWFASEDGDAHVQLEQSALREALAAGIGCLPEREAMVLQLYYVEELNLEEIGEVLEVGAARVCQIKKSALTRLRAHLAEWRD